MSIVGSKSDDFVVVETVQKMDEKFIITQEDGGGGGHHSNAPAPVSNMIDNDKKMRRQIANSNERRRMQSINAGFQSLRLLLPHHEGEKLSKAAILQQTAEFVFNLEQDKNRLMSNVTYLRDLLLKHNINPDLPNVSVNSTGTTSAITSTVSGKKRKLDNVMTMQTISDSSDEGLGSMSPEPLTFVTVMTKPNGGITTTTSSSAAATTNSILAKEVVDLKHQLEIERRQRMMLEDQLRQMECQVYPDRLSRDERIYAHQEVIEHTDNIRVDDSDMVDTTDGVDVIEEDDDESTTTISILNNNPMTKVSLSQLSELQKTHSLQDVQVLSIDSLPDNGQNVVVCSPVVDEISIEEARVLSPAAMEVVCKEEMEKVEISTKQRLQPILEAVIKAEPKVEVERISNSPVSLTVVKSEDSSTSSSAQQSRMYLTSTSRQNLETIVEAIRHLEGDHLFGETTQEQQQPTQEAPLALTNKQSHVQVHHPHTRKIHVDVNPFLHFRSPSAASAAQHLQQQCRPGVIVVKQNS